MSGLAAIVPIVGRTQTMELLTTTPTATPNRDSILTTIRDENATSTQKAYAQAMKSLFTYYERQGWEFYPSAPDSTGVFVERVLSYLRHLADEGRSLSTINKTLAAVKSHVTYENPTYYAALQTKLVKAFMEGLTRQLRDHTPRKAQAFTVADLKLIHKHLSKKHTPRAVRDRALIALGIATALRSSNIGTLTLSDITPALTIDGLNVRVRFSKTDQHGKGHTVPVARAADRLLDPVRAVNEWVGVLASYGFTRESAPDFPLFPAVRGQRGVQPTPMLHPNIAITELLRSVVGASGVSTSTDVYSSHSLRATFITLSNQANVSEKDIAAVSGHRDMNTLRSYDRTTVERAAQADYLNA